MSARKVDMTEAEAYESGIEVEKYNLISRSESREN